MKVLSFFAIVLLSIPVLGAPTIGVDFDQTGGITTQAGFFSFDLPSSGVTLPTSRTFSSFGDLTVTLFSGQTGNFLRGGFTNSGTYTYANLMNDFTYNNISPTLRFQLSGPTIAPNMAHQIQIWGVDPDATVNPTLVVGPTSGTGTLGGTGTIVDDGSAPTSNSSFSTTLIFTANSSGVIDFSATATTMPPRVNGFEITFLPEPSALGVLMLGGLLLRRPRRS